MKFVFSEGEKNAAFLFLCSVYFLLLCNPCREQNATQENIQLTPLATKPCVRRLDSQLSEKIKECLAGGCSRRCYLCWSDTSHTAAGRPKTRGEQLTLSGRGGRGLRCHTGRSGGAAPRKRLRSGTDETLSPLTGCFQKTENTDLKYLWESNPGHINKVGGGGGGEEPIRHQWSRTGGGVVGKR